jgi:subtilisin-like proprotein convertase family protein
VPVQIANGLGTSSQQLVAGLSGVILDVDVTLDIAHSYDSDLRVFLWGPSPTHPGSAIRSPPPLTSTGTAPWT